MLVNSAITTDGSAAPTHVAMIGGKVFSGVPAEETAGDLVAPWMDTFRRLIIYGFSFTSEALEIEDVAPAIVAPFEPVTTTQLTAPGVTEVIEILDFNRLAAQVVVASIDTNVIVRLEGSHDNSAWFPLGLEAEAVANLTISGAQATIVANGTYLLMTPSISTAFARARFVSEAGGTAATLDFTLKAKT